jgi:hypothetical protein
VFPSHRHNNAETQSTLFSVNTDSSENDTIINISLNQIGFGVISTLVVIGLTFSINKLDSVDRKIDTMSSEIIQRFDTISKETNQKLDALSTETNRKFDAVNENLRNLQTKLDVSFLGATIALGIFAASGNIVKVLEYFDKKFASKSS